MPILPDAAEYRTGRSLCRTRLLSGLLLGLLLLTGGCAQLLTRPLLDPLSQSLDRQADLRLLRDGTPALLLMLDGLIANNPQNRNLLIAGARAYSSFASLLEENGDRERAATTSLKAKGYGLALLRQFSGLAGLPAVGPADLQRALASTTTKDVAGLFWGGYGWANWIRYQNGSPAAMAELPTVEQIIRRCVELDETYYHGAAHVFLGAYYASLPAALGGRHQESRHHFEQALAIGQRRFLLAQVAYAETYARQTFDRELFTALLKEVIDQPEADNELAAGNALAKAMAKRLLAAVDDYF